MTVTLGEFFDALGADRCARMRLLMRMAFGFRDADALIGVAMLAPGGYRPDLPGRAS